MFAKCKRYNPGYLSLKPEIYYLPLGGQLLQQEHHPAASRGQAPATDTLDCQVFTGLSSFLVVGTVISGPAKQEKSEARTPVEQYVEPGAQATTQSKPGCPNH